MPQWLTKQEAAEYLGLSVKQLQSQCDAKKLTYYVIANERKFKEEDLIEYVNASLHRAER